MEAFSRIPETLKSFRETRLSNLRSPREFFDYHQVSVPKDLAQIMTRITYNIRYFSGNYSIIAAMLTVYAIIGNFWVLIVIAWFVLGFTAITKFGPEPMQVGEHVVSQSSLYIGLFVVGIPLLWWSSPLSMLVFIVGASGFLILIHACLMEPGLESEYGAVEEGNGL